MISSPLKTCNAALPDTLLDETARALLSITRGVVSRREPMSRHTTFRVGGPADLFIAPEDETDLSAALAVLAAAGVPVMVLGNGSNLLVADAGIRGAIIKLTPRFAEITREGDTLVVGAGAKLAAVVHAAAREGLSGLESTMGIPGTVGGALVMNAGTDVGSISDLVHTAACLTHAGERQEWEHAGLSFGYRESTLQDGLLIVLSARLSLVPGDHDAILDKMARLNKKRTSRQPTGRRTAGCTFRNLWDPDGTRWAAGKLVDRAGGKGHRIGGAEVSTRHANFIIARPGATASDVRNLMNWMHRLVLDTHGRDMQTEIELVGDWSGWRPDEEA